MAFSCFPSLGYFAFVNEIISCAAKAKASLSITHFPLTMDGSTVSVRKDNAWRKEAEPGEKAKNPIPISLLTNIETDAGKIGGSLCL